jgi:DNA-binding transcriptional LysR family regulator
MQKEHSHDIDFGHLRTFLTLARLGNFSQTGRHLGLSQSAVSRHIRALEDTLGLRLFQRLGRRAVLTSAGQTLQTRMATLMREAEALPRVMKDLAEGVQGDIRVGASITSAHAVLPSLLGAYRHRYAKVALALQPGNSADVLASLARGEIDLAFVGSDTLPPGTSALAEIADHLVLIAPPAHPLAGRRLKSADLAGFDFIQRDAQSDTRALVDRWFQAERVKPRTVMEVG